ncbi:ribonuclease H-like domain-containing protein [Tanacetum coccineum]
MNKSFQNIVFDSSNNKVDTLNFFNDNQTPSPNDEGRGLNNSAPNEGGDAHPDHSDGQDEGDAASMGDNSYSEGNVPSSSNVDTIRGEPENSSQVQPDLRRSSRTSKQPARFNDFVVGSSKLYGLEKYVTYANLSRSNFCTQAMECQAAMTLVENGLCAFKEMLKSKFQIKDLGNLKYFLGIEVIDNDDGVCLSQRKYCLEVLHEYGLLAGRPVETPLAENTTLNHVESEDDKLLSDIGNYQKLVGKLIYLTNTRPDISYAVHCLSQFMHAPLSSHLEAAFRVLRYLKNSPGSGIQINKHVHSEEDIDYLTDQTGRLSTTLEGPKLPSCMVGVGPSVDSVSNLDCSNVLHLQNSDFNVTNVISIKLSGTENYRVWAAAMRLAINTRNKTGFIDGTCLKETYASSAVYSSQWDRCNSIVLSWLLNSVSDDLYLGQIFSENASEVWSELKETYDKFDGSVTLNLLNKIHNFKQGELTVSEYYHKLNSLWREFDIMTKLPKCSCAAREDVLVHNQLMKLMQFLMGLNDVYQPIRSSILSRENLPEVKDAFAIISREESHRGIASTSSGSLAKPQISGFVSSTNNWSNNGNKKNNNKKFSHNNPNYRGPNPNLKCTNCEKTGHTVDRCFDLIGYPPGYNRNPAPRPNNFRPYSANNASPLENGAPLSFTNDQMMKLMNLINDVPSGSNTGNIQANLAGSFLEVDY